MHRYFERSLKWLFRPDDNMILAELEARQGTVSMKPAKPDPRPIYPVVEDPQAVCFPSVFATYVDCRNCNAEHQVTVAVHYRHQQAQQSRSPSTLLHLWQCPQHRAQKICPGQVNSTSVMLLMHTQGAYLEQVHKTGLMAHSVAHEALIGQFRSFPKCQCSDCLQHLYLVMGACLPVLL